jgi:hypothetical protein
MASRLKQQQPDTALQQTIRRSRARALRARNGSGWVVVASLGATLLGWAVVAHGDALLLLLQTVQ